MPTLPPTRFVAPIAGGLSLLQLRDPALAAAILGETVRQEDGLEMIASENYVSPGVLAAVGSVLTNKYAEGYPGRRYYGGCQEVDKAELLAIERARQLFGVDYANVQPHSGSTANMGVYMAFLKPGDKIMGMALAAGGHLTHGHSVNFSGRVYKSVQYGVHPETGLIDMEQVYEMAVREGPQMIVVGASAYSRDFDYPGFRTIADKVGAILFVDMAHPAGLIAAKLLRSPFPHADVVSTTNHKTLRGPRGGMILMGKDVQNRQGLTVGKPPRPTMMSEVIDKTIMPGIQGGPLMHVIAGKAVALGEALDPSFAVYAHQVVDNARALAEVFVASGLHVVSGGTDNHLMLVDLSRGHDDWVGKGKEAERLLGAAGITVNANMVPGDRGTAFKPSGLRIGTPALTTRGMGTNEMRQIGAWIAALLKSPGDAGLVAEVGGRVSELCHGFPLYRELGEDA